MSLSSGTIVGGRLYPPGSLRAESRIFIIIYTYIYLYIYIYLQARFAAFGHFMSAESPCRRLELTNLAYSLGIFT